MSKKLSIPYFVWMTIFVLLPLILVLFFAFTTKNGQFTFSNFSIIIDYWSVFKNSFWLAFIATILCLLIGYPVAYLVARETKTVQNICMVLLMLPMWINFLLRTYAWLSILEKNGFLNKLLVFMHLPKLNIINTPTAVVLGMIYNYLPFMILPILTVIQKLDHSLIEAAQDLGSNQLTVFRRVIFPLSLPGILSGITMVFVPSVSTFVISKLLGGGKTLLLGDLIEMQFLGNAYNPQVGAAISLTMMVVVLICMYAMNRFGEGEKEAMLL